MMRKLDDLDYLSIQQELPRPSLSSTPPLCVKHSMLMQLVVEYKRFQDVYAYSTAEKKFVPIEAYGEPADSFWSCPGCAVENRDKGSPV